MVQLGASTLSGVQTATHDGGAAHHEVVALGDSVPSGAACSCSPFPTLYAALLQQRTGVPASVDNAAVSGLTTTGLLGQLRQPALRDALAGADVVLVTVGANDFLDHHDDVVGGSCAPGDAADCISDDLESMRAHLVRALGQIRSLRHDQPTTVLVTGYWNVFEDGTVATQSSGPSGLESSLTLTRTVNTAIRSLAEDAGDRYVDIFTPFEDGGHDIDSLLAGDGNHPDAAGHQLIATKLLAAGLPRATWARPGA